VRDTAQGDIGIIVGPLVRQPLFGMGYCETQLILWPSNRGEAMEMDLSAIEEGWVEVISEGLKE
tara:strand:+ start:1996 stop:2187 length:192 start_codon:yes stop_codon:yes gene_type:complete